MQKMVHLRVELWYTDIDYFKEEPAHHSTATLQKYKVCMQLLVCFKKFLSTITLSSSMRFIYFIFWADQLLSYNGFFSEYICCCIEANTVEVFLICYGRYISRYVGCYINYRNDEQH
jgi:hypothetical protein